MIATSGTPEDRGTLDEFLAADDIVPLAPLDDAAWNHLRRKALRRIVWHFCTPRNLWVHRGRFLRDVIGYGWAGIFRSLRVGAIVTTSYRNEGHFRAGERIFGTSDFFSGAFRLPRSSADLAELVRVVNLRHHVAGVVSRHAVGGLARHAVGGLARHAVGGLARHAVGGLARHAVGGLARNAVGGLARHADTPTDDGGCGVRVVPGYEADYCYVATAFIESLRRGYAACGVAPDGPRGRTLGAELCTILYQVAGFTGLSRRPRDLAAHERFRDAYERRLAARPPSPRVSRMAREIACRIVPLTAAMADVTIRDHADRHFDAATRRLLFPDGDIPAELERRRGDWVTRLARLPSLWSGTTRSAARAAIWRRADVAALLAAYRAAPPELTADRLIGAILLHALDEEGPTSVPLERRTIDLPARGELIRQGQTVGEMYVVLSSTAPLVVLRAAGDEAGPRQVATLSAPTVLGEIGMWRGQPAVATVTTRVPNRLELLVIDRERFTALQEEPGFRAATAAEVQRRLALNAALVGTLLDDAAASGGSPLLASIAQLFRYLTGDSHVPLDAVIGLPEEATPAECVDALRRQVDEAVRAGGLPPDLERHLGGVVATIG